MGVILNWADQTAQDLDRIEIYRSTAPIDSASPGPVLALLAGTAVTYEDNTVVNKTIYYYRVVAVKGDERSWGSNQMVGYFADTGPGRQTPLRGDWNAGLMDFITPANFITNAALRAKVPALFGLTNAGEPTLWYKMCWKGKVFMVPNANIVSASWAQLYNAGLVYGENGVGERPTAIGVGAVNQMVTVEIAGNRYLLRCPKTSSLPDNEFSVGQADTLNSEWRDTVGRMSLLSLDPQATAKDRLYDSTSSPAVFGSNYASVGNIAIFAANKPETYATLAGGTALSVALVLELIMP